MKRALLLTIGSVTSAGEASVQLFDSSYVTLLVTSNSDLIAFFVVDLVAVGSIVIRNVIRATTNENFKKHHSSTEIAVEHQIIAVSVVSDAFS